MSGTTKKIPADNNAQLLEPALENQPAVVEEKPHDPGHGRWILDPVTGEKRNNNEE